MSFPAYPEYKDSGVVWLGGIPAHWNIKNSDMFSKKALKRSPMRWWAICCLFLDIEALR